KSYARIDETPFPFRLKFTVLVENSIFKTALAGPSATGWKFSVIVSDWFGAINTGSSGRLPILKASSVVVMLLSIAVRLARFTMTNVAVLVWLSDGVVR